MPIDMNVFFFGNSLVNFAGGNAQTNVPLWMDRFAGADGNGLAVEGGYGFLRNFADREEPVANWGFEGVAGVYENGGGNFFDANFDALVITPANFIQDQAPWEAYFDDDRSPLSAMIETVSNASAVQPDARVFVYEGWADMGPFAPDGAPSDAALSAYHNFNQGDYHAWYETLVEATNAETGADVTLIPVASILSEILDESPLSDIPAEALYVDSAPHGTETTYFLAAMITYGAIYGEMPPPDFFVPESVHPLVGTYFIEINEDIAAALNEAGFNVRVPQAGDNDDFDSFLLAQGFGEGEGASEGAEEPVDEEPVFAAEPAEEEEPDAPFPVPEEPVFEEPAFEEAAEDPAGVARAADDPDAAVPCFERTVDAGEGGLFTFSLISDDPSELFINGERVLTNSGEDPGTAQSVTIDVPPGEVNLAVYYYEQDGGEILILDAGPALPSEIAGLPATEFADEDDAITEEEEAEFV